MKQETPPPKRRRRLLRWMRRLFYLGCIGIVLLAGAGWWAWSERVTVVNSLLLRLGGDVQVKFAALDWVNGVLHLKEVSATHVPTAQRLVEAGRIEWQPDWRELRGKNLGSVKIEGGSVDIPLTMFSKPGSGKAAADGTAAASAWRLDSLDLASTKVTIRDEKPAPLMSATVQGNVRGGTMAGAFEAAVIKVTDLVWQDKPLLSSLQVEAAMKDGKIEIKKGSLRAGHIDLAWVKAFSPALSDQLPPLRGGVQFEWEGHDLAFSRDGLIAGGTHELRLKNLSLQPLADAGGVKAAAVEVKLSQDLNGVWHVEHGLLLKPEIEWTPELEAALLPKSESKQASAWKLQVDGMEVRDGKVVLSPTKLSPVAGEFGWSTKLVALEISPAGMRSASKQRLVLENLSLRWGRMDPSLKPRPFATAKNGVLELVPDKLRELWFVESLVLDEPHFEFTPENGPWFDKVVAEPVKPLSANPEPTWWRRLQFGMLTAQGGAVAVAMKLAERVEISTHFEIATEQAKQRLSIADTRVRIPTRANLPVLSFEKVEAVAALPEMWRTRRVESLKLTGGQTEVGDALMTLFSGQAAVVEEKAEAVAARWTAGKIEVEKLGVTLMSIAPGLPPVRFDVTFSANETPLDLDGLAENVEPQQIVLTRLRIPSPHEPLRTVAEMDMIQVTYTLDGLLHRRIDRVEIVSPLLYVGEDLFWYVENYRKFMKGEEQVPDATVGPTQPPKPRVPGWRVDTLAVADGRLVLAPKGVPLRGFSKPFPFSFTTKLESGQLDAEFEIPTDNYTLEHLKLEFRGMKGKVLFNLPMKDRNNNLTETFTVEQVRWKQLHLEKAHLSVTYDTNGIYGTFGGAAYGGYVNGAFDIYLDEAYTWDGWVSGVGVDLGPVTTVMFPRYFLLNGVVEGKIIATGNKSELYQADGEFKNRSRGKFSIAALNDMIAALPQAMTGTLTDQITRIGLETLRDFEYDSVDSKARFYGREGRGHLRFIGPYGARNFDINVYDHRWKEEPRKPTTADAVATP
ncbi:MAG: hypothetical protein ACKVY0_15410 [Prosthecobacter sp.]|uniref:hypothetical protein n=1 Tax=Prosthecobacter sp. TaxID=1965333 RepID=UPI0038FDF8F0